jgi:predicted glycosyltransferase
MRFVFDLTHPAVVHMYLPVIAELRQRGHSSTVVSREKDLTTTLLNEGGIDHIVLSKAKSGTIPMAIELAQRELGLLRVALRCRPHVIAGTSVNAARVAKLTGARSVINNEDDASAVPLFRWSAYPLADAIVTPWVLAHEDYGPRHLTYRAFEKLFYLHPSRFSPDTDIRDKLGAGSPNGRYILFRFSALKAHHDKGARGMQRELIQRLIDQFANKTNIWISSENTVPSEWERYIYPLPKLTMHHALAQSSALLCDSQSMSVEAAMLGIKSFRLNSFVGRLSVLNELDRRELTEGFLPDQDAEFEERVFSYMSNLDRELEAQAQRRVQFLRETIDPVPWYVDVLEHIAKGEGITPRV